MEILAFFAYIIYPIKLGIIRKIDRENFHTIISELKEWFIFYILMIVILTILLLISITSSKKPADRLFGDLSWTLLICIIILIIIFMFCAVLASHKLHKMNITDPYTETSDTLMRKVFFEKNMDSEKTIQYYLEHHNTHEDFMSEFTQYSCSRPLDLDIISQKALLSENAHFYCVISNSEYFVNNNNGLSKQTEDLISYFLSFEKITGKNLITRIFTFPKLTEYDKEKFGKNVDKKLRIILFQYMIINEITGVNTYLLEYDKDQETGFAKCLDYVLMKNKNESILYFSYEKEKDKDLVVETTDNFLTKIIENDFHARMKFLYQPSSKANCIKISKKNYKEIVDILDLTKIDVDQAIAEINNNVSTLVMKAKIPNSEQHAFKQKIKKELKKWK